VIRDLIVEFADKPI